jgi:hypothetical protein
MVAATAVPPDAELTGMLVAIALVAIAVSLVRAAPATAAGLGAVRMCMQPLAVVPGTVARNVVGCSAEGRIT